MDNLQLNLQKPFGIKLRLHFFPKCVLILEDMYRLSRVQKIEYEHYPAIKCSIQQAEK